MAPEEKEKGSDALPRGAEVAFPDDAAKRVLRSLSAAALAANGLPSGDARLVGQLTSATLASALERIVTRTRALLDNALVRGLRAPADLALPEAYADALDAALELAHTALDDAEGFRDAPLDDAHIAAAATATANRQQAALAEPKVERRKPQLDFHDYPIDNSDAPFVPPFGAAVAADTSPEASAERYLEQLGRSNGAGGRKEGVHPYEAEIAESVRANTARVALFDPEDVTVFRPLKETPCTFVDTEKALLAVAERLSRTTILAVDLENHSERSFLGFTCLIQISTRKEDFIIDALKLRALVHRALAPIFADPAIVKVLHGANNDIEWLERDFGMYVVNLFDTGQAARLLCYPLLSLSYLLAKFCDVSAKNKKKMQRSDWRQRPLPQDKLDYARNDTHFLLYIYDRLRAELAKEKKLPEAYERSAAVARRRFHKPTFNAGSARTLAAKHGLGLDAHQMRVLEELCRWRDVTAREIDESVPYVLSNSVMFAIARARDVARTPVGICEALALKKAQAPVVRARADVLSRLISDALDAKIDPEAAVGLPEKVEKLRRKRGRKGRTIEETGRKKEKQAESDASCESEKDQVDGPGVQNAGQAAGAKNGETVAETPALLQKPISLPEVEVKSARVSSLWEDDSSSEESEGQAQVAAETRAVELPEKGLALSQAAETPETKAEVPQTGQEPIQQARKSVFDLSDSEGDDDESTVGHDEQLAPEPREDTGAKDAEIENTCASEKVANVLADIEATSRAALSQFSSFDKRPLPQNELEETPAPEEVAPEQPAEPEYRPLSWRAQKPEGERKKKRRKSKHRAAVEAPAVVPFDYAAAAVQDRAAKKKRRSPEPFDVLAGLKPGSVAGKRPKKPKKNPASGSRSMSFKAGRRK